MTIETIKCNATYKQVLADSFGGVMYNVANRGKYEGTQQVISLWDQLTENQKDAAGGIMKGAIAFLKGDI